MITMNELLQGRAKLIDLDKETQVNLQLLLIKINIVRKAYGKPLKVNDGYRRPQDTPANGASKSKHLIGAAVDIDDNDAGDFWNWCKDNLEIIWEAGLWIEDPRYTHGKSGTWMHFQSVPPASGKFIFIPSSAPASAPDIWDGNYPTKYNKPKK
jgi:hypothetical protein